MPEGLDNTEKMIQNEDEKLSPIIKTTIIEASHISEITPLKSRKESLSDFLKNLGSVTALNNNNDNFRSSTIGILHQCIATFAVLILTTSAGQPIGFSAILLPQLYNENSTLQVDLNIGSWIASIHSAASPVGSLTAGTIMEHWGRRRTLELSVPPMIIGWLCLSLASNLSTIIVGRCLCGYSVGVIAAASQVYIGELSDPWLRGLLIGTPFVSYSIGILAVYSLGELPWRITGFTCLILPTISGIFLYFMPESPVWLIRHSKISQAYSALEWLRGDKALVKKELSHIARIRATEKYKQTSNQSFFDLIKQPPVYKPLIIINIFNVIQLLCGTYIVIFYAVDIIQDAVGDKIDSLKIAIYTAATRLLFAIIACFFLLYSTRRTLSIISGVSSSIASLSLATYLYMQTGKEKSNMDFWIVGTFLLIYIASNTLGFMVLPSLMTAELLPEKVRGICGGYIFMIYNILLFVAARTYPFIKIYCKSEGLFLIFGISSLIGSLFLFLTLPETKNKTLLQIERYFEKSNLLWITSRNMMPKS